MTAVPEILRSLIGAGAEENDFEHERKYNRILGKGQEDFGFHYFSCLSFANFVNFLMRATINLHIVSSLPASCSISIIEGASVK